MMKNVLLFLSVVGLISLSSCDPEKERMEVIRNCTGTYLRSNSGQDFLVCNENILSGYSDGKKIRVKYDNLNECFGLIEPLDCTETFTYQGEIEVTEVF